MLIAKIVSSNSHIDYVARVVDEFDGPEVPAFDDYGFGKFVSVGFGDGVVVIGLVYNTMLVNPEFASYGPRLSPRPELGSFSPDYLNEQGVLIGILLLGSIGADGSVSQGVPARTIPAGGEVNSISEESFRTFHRGSGRLSVHYLSQIMAHAGPFAVPLLESVIVRLGKVADDDDKRRLSLLRQNLEWQRTMGGSRL